MFSAVSFHFTALMLFLQLPDHILLGWKGTVSTMSKEGMLIAYKMNIDVKDIFQVLAYCP